MNLHSKFELAGQKTPRVEQHYIFNVIFISIISEFGLISLLTSTFIAVYWPGKSGALQEILPQSDGKHTRIMIQSIFYTRAAKIVKFENEQRTSRRTALRRVPSRSLRISTCDAHKVLHIQVWKWCLICNIFCIEMGVSELPWLGWYCIAWNARMLQEYCDMSQIQDLLRKLNSAVPPCTGRVIVSNKHYNSCEYVAEVLAKPGDINP